MNQLFWFYLLILFVSTPSIALYSQEKPFDSPVNSVEKPWSDRSFLNSPDDFQFAIVTDRTGGHRAGIFGKAVEKLNLLMPEFVMSVGDLIEGSMYPDTISRQWAEFDSLLTPLNMRFFYVPGNHDIANETMRKAWVRRYGQTYYHFVYKEVLFLAFDSTDGDDDATFSREQIDYFKNALEENPDVRWTLIFMHHPIWMYPTRVLFEEIEDALGERPYTVFAGHHHIYRQAIRNKRDYYVLATTGGGSRLRGPRFGEFDHITWITMRDEGPNMLNLKLDGMLSPDIAPADEQGLRRALIEATDFHGIMTANAEENAGIIQLSINNQSTDSLYLWAKVYHHHDLQLNSSNIQAVIPPKGTERIRWEWTLQGRKPLALIDPLEVDFTLGYKTEVGEPEFTLSGIYTLPSEIQAYDIQFTEPNLFLQQQEVAMETAVGDLEIRYTLDGSKPTYSSPLYTVPFTLSQSAEVKAAFFDAKTQTGTGYLEKSFVKVRPERAQRPKNTQPGLSYQYVEGNFLTLPNFDTLQVVREGIAMDFEVAAVAKSRIDHYAITYKGYIEVPETGLYTFYTHSDDGSQLYIHDQLVVDNNGSHSARTRKGYIALERGLHPIRIAYFEDFLGQELNLFMQVPGQLNRERVSFEYLRH